MVQAKLLTFVTAVTSPCMWRCIVRGKIITMIISTIDVQCT